MNNEKQIAQAILDAQKMRNESYHHDRQELEEESFGEYKLDIEECFIATCKQQGLSPNLWSLLSLANHWYNDIQLWAEDVLAGKNILEECQKEHEKIDAEICAEFDQTEKLRKPSREEDAYNSSPEIDT